MRQAGASKAIGAGAFGGSRSGVQAAETESHCRAKNKTP